jgi:hypothetical protein
MSFYGYDWDVFGSIYSAVESEGGEFIDIFVL